MTINVTGLLGGPDTCLPQYALSDDMVCEGRVSGLDITDNGSTITVSAGSAYVTVVDADGTEFNIKVYLDADEILPKISNGDVIITVPLANVQNPSNNTNLSTIATLSMVASGTGGTYHLVLATTNGAGVVSEVLNAGHYLPGCDFCLRCEGGVLQLPPIETDSIVTDSIDATVGNFGDLNATGVITGDGSGLTGISAASLNYATTSSQGVVEIATQAEYDSKTNETRMPTIKQIWESMPRTPNTDVYHIGFSTDLSLDYFTNSVTPVLLDSFVSETGGTYLLDYGIRGSNSSTASHYIKVGDVIQNEFTTPPNNTLYRNEEYIHVGRGETVEIYGYTSNASFSANFFGYNISSD